MATSQDTAPLVLALVPDDTQSPRFRRGELLMLQPAEAPTAQEPAWLHTEAGPIQYEIVGRISQSSAARYAWAANLPTARFA